jgi:asparagine synthase (glutamine-hydrolysing)
MRGAPERHVGRSRSTIVANGTVFGARDRWGIKPLFVHSQGRTTIVASEIKCILASGLYTARLDRSAAAAFLYENELDEAVSTFFQGIGQIPPGHAFRISRDGTLSESRYWSLSAIAEQGNPADPARRTSPNSSRTPCACTCAATCRWA